MLPISVVQGGPLIIDHEPSTMQYYITAYFTQGMDPISKIHAGFSTLLSTMQHWNHFSLTVHILTHFHTQRTILQCVCSSLLHVFLLTQNLECQDYSYKSFVGSGFYQMPERLEMLENSAGNVNVSKSQKVVCLQTEY